MVCSASSDKSQSVPLPRTRRLCFAEACRYEKAEEIIFHKGTSRKIALMISSRRLEVRQGFFLNKRYPAVQIVAGLKILSSGFSSLHRVKFITLQYGEIPYLGGPLGLPKVKGACHCTWPKFKE
jgi:hypothetical protein